MQFAQRLHDRFGKGLSRFSMEGVVATTGIGVPTMVPEDQSYGDTLRRANRALYEAESVGRDRVVSA